MPQHLPRRPRAHAHRHTGSNALSIFRLMISLFIAAIIIAQAGE